MNLSAPFVRRPIGTVLLTVGVALAGIGGFFALPVSPLAGCVGRPAARLPGWLFGPTEDEEAVAATVGGGGAAGVGSPVPARMLGAEPAETDGGR